MTWFRVEDTLSGHQKARQAGLPAMGLWVLAGSYCAQQLTDGHVPGWFVASWPSGAKHAAALVKAGLWIETDDGWQFREWDRRNPSRAVEMARKEKRRRATQAWRDKQGLGDDT